MTAPIGADVGEVFEAMRNAVIDLLFVWISLVVRFTDTLCDDLRVAFGVADILAILAPHASRVLEQISTQCASHDIVELLLDEFVALLLVHFLFLLTDGTLSVETQVKWSSLTGLLLKVHRQVDPTSRL